MLKANIGILAKSDVIVWQGWVVYSWDMGFAAYLFRDKPKKDGDEDLGWSFDNAIEISPYFLQTCGVDIDFERAGDEGTEFYYGKESDWCGNHNPIRIKLTMPRILLEQLGIDTSDIPSTAQCNEPHK